MPADGSWYRTPQGGNVPGSAPLVPTGNLDPNGLPIYGPLSSTNSLPISGSVGGYVGRISSNFTRPNNTTPYASGQLVANSTAAGSVAPLSFALSRSTGKGGMIRRVRLRKTGTSITNASFRLHLYSAVPTPSNGDGGAWLTDQAAAYVGSMDVTCNAVFTDGASGNGVPNTGSEIIFTADTYYGLIEARAAYTPTAQEVLTLLLEVIQN